MSDVIEQNKLWTACNEDGKRFFTQYSNCIIQGIISGKFKPIESRMILYIGRWTDGFKRDESNKYLSTDDFMKELKISSPQFCTTMNKLLMDKIVFRGKRIGNSYKYAINLLTYGIHMKHYKIVKAGYELCNEEYTFDNKSYSFCNKEEVKNDAIVYNSSGYDKSEKLYINTNINTDINLDIKHDSVDDASASRFRAPSAEADKNKSSTATKSTVTSPIGATTSETTPRVFVRNGKKINLDIKDRDAEIKAIASDVVGREKELTRISQEFKNTIKQDSSPETILKFMEQYKAIGVYPYTPRNICLSNKDKIANEGVFLDLDNVWEAEQMFSEKYKGFNAEFNKGGMSIARIISFGNRNY